jgi:hypothetical protein
MHLLLLAALALGWASSARAVDAVVRMAPDYEESDSGTFFVPERLPSDPAQPVQPERSPSDVAPPMVPMPPAARPGCGAWEEPAACCCGPLFDECQDCGPVAWYAFSGFDSWRGFADGTYEDNKGLHFGLNAGGLLTDGGLAWQAGMSYGIYDWNGRDSWPLEAEDSQTQTFITLGVFRRANESSRWSGGIVLDQMIGDNFGVFANEPYLAQVRYQLAYALSARNEIGFWATNELNHDTQFLGPVPISTRAVNQANLFWHHKFDLGADGWFYVGLPTNDRVGAPGRLGDFIFGVNMNVPLSDSLAMYANFAYLEPSAPLPLGASEDSFNFTLGLAWYPQWNARSRSVAGRQSMPYLPVANNGTFFIDQNVTL